VDGFVATAAPLTGLELYHLLEGATPLLQFHTIFRSGIWNRYRNGLQQSYGDHNRLLLLGIDRLVEGDVEWYLSRLATPGEASRADLARCIERVRGLDLGRDVLACLWIAAALHDYGMLSGRQGGLDVEDGVALAAPVIDTLCAGPLQELARFAVRHHDYVKDVFAGGVPVGFIASDRDRLAAALRRPAVAALGIIQVAGAASLGEGRLSRRRLDIADRCFDGSALADDSSETRLARLLGDGAVDVPAEARAAAADRLGALTAGTRDRLIALLARVPLHRWERLRAAAMDPVSGSESVSAIDPRRATVHDRATDPARMPEARKPEPSRERLLALLGEIAARWTDAGMPEHVDLAPDIGEAVARWPGHGRLPLEPGPLHALMNGTRALPLHA
jgi:hypothetical protein